MSETIYDRIVALPRGDSRRQEIAAVLGCHHLSTAMLRIQKIDDPDEKAQEHLASYLESHKLKPTIVIHRGHSYHVKYTIKQLPPSARIVILGSCGGYHNLDDVLRTCPDAHIISSKEVGTKSVNEPILRAINEDLRQGKNVEWIPMWKMLAEKFTSVEGKERFDNYIPPHKNLGALFLKAYTKAMGTE